MCTLLIHKQIVATQCYVDLPHVDISPVIIFENECKIFKKFKKLEVFRKRKLPKLNEFPENLRCSNINGATHKLLVRECLTGAKSVR